MAPHVEVGKVTIHYCVTCKERVHTFCISKTDNGKIICSGCDILHAYTDSIQCHHPVDPAWKRDLISYYNKRNGIPNGFSFLTGDEYLQSQAICQNANKRTTNNSSGKVDSRKKSAKKRSAPTTRRAIRRRVSSLK